MRNDYLAIVRHCFFAGGGNNEAMNILTKFLWFIVVFIAAALLGVLFLALSGRLDQDINNSIVQESNTSESIKNDSFSGEQLGLRLPGGISASTTAGLAPTSVSATIKTKTITLNNDVALPISFSIPDYFKEVTTKSNYLKSFIYCEGGGNWTSNPSSNGGMCGDNSKMYSIFVAFTPADNEIREWASLTPVTFGSINGFIGVAEENSFTFLGQPTGLSKLVISLSADQDFRTRFLQKTLPSTHPYYTFLNSLKVTATPEAVAAENFKAKVIAGNFNFSFKGESIQFNDLKFTHSLGSGSLIPSMSVFADVNGDGLQDLSIPFSVYGYESGQNVLWGLMIFLNKNGEPELKAMEELPQGSDTYIYVESLKIESGLIKVRINTGTNAGYVSTYQFINNTLVSKNSTSY